MCVFLGFSHVIPPWPSSPTAVMGPHERRSIAVTAALLLTRHVPVGVTGSRPARYGSAAAPRPACPTLPGLGLFLCAVLNLPCRRLRRWLNHAPVRYPMASGSRGSMCDSRAGSPLSRRMTPETHIGKISACEMGVRSSCREAAPRPHTGRRSPTCEALTSTLASIRHRPPSRPARRRHSHVQRPAPPSRTQVLGPPLQPRITRVNTLRPRPGRRHAESPGHPTG